MDDDDLLLEPHLANILESDLQWIFVGGKGGVGKTTTSCCLALQLARKRAPAGSDKKVLLLSTDPAHNISDTLGQKFGADPVRVEGVSDANLYAMEVDPSKYRKQEEREAEERAERQAANGNAGEDGEMVDAVETTGELVGTDATMAVPSQQDPMSAMMKDVVSSLPGIEEAMAFAELMKYIQGAEFDCRRKDIRRFQGAEFDTRSRVGPGIVGIPIGFLRLCADQFVVLVRRNHDTYSHWNNDHTSHSQ